MHYWLNSWIEMFSFPVLFEVIFSQLSKINFHYGKRLIALALTNLCCRWINWVEQCSKDWNARGFKLYFLSDNQLTFVLFQPPLPYPIATTHECRWIKEAGLHGRRVSKQEMWLGCVHCWIIRSREKRILHLKRNVMSDEKNSKEEKIDVPG